MRKLLVLMLLAAMILPATVPVLAQEAPALPALDDLRRGWSILEPGGETTCARGTPYRFFVRNTGQTDKLMIYFQGGGACWNALTCREGGSYDPEVSYWSAEVGGYGGIFNVRNASNPLRDYAVVFIPYCTADVHLGDATVRYLGNRIQHRGAVNAQAALDWAFENFSAPTDVFVTGSSAGAYGAIYFTADIAERYPDARVVQLGDAGVGATPAGWLVLEQWGMYENIHDYLTPIDPAEFTINDLYDRTAEKFPNVVLSQFTNANDETQELFYNFAGIRGGPSWQDLMYSNLDTLEDTLDRFTSYVAGGTEHVILARDTLYTLTSNGVPFIDWLTALVSGDMPESVRCVNCARAEYSR